MMKKLVIGILCNFASNQTMPVAVNLPKKNLFPLMGTLIKHSIPISVGLLAGGRIIFSNDLDAHDSKDQTLILLCTFISATSLYIEAANLYNPNWIGNYSKADIKESYTQGKKDASWFKSSINFLKKLVLRRI